MADRGFSRSNVPSRDGALACSRSGNNAARWNRHPDGNENPTTFPVIVWQASCI